jgi:PPM family protein phosphatase
MGLRIAEETGRTDVGRQRQSNEDRFLEAPPVYAVADGMGGARAGEVASRIAVDALAHELETGGNPEEQLAEVVREANRRIWEMAQSDDEHAGMGTTLTAVLVGDRDIAIGHVGDSRLYRLRDGELERLTTDHSLVEEYLRAGKLSPEQAENHPQRSIITRALGPEPDVDVDTFTCEGRDGDVYLLCSDGLTGMVAEAEVRAIIERGESLEQTAGELVEEANRAGGRDNITVVLFRLAAGARDEDGDADADTLSGRETETGLSAGDVRAAVAAAEAERAPAAAASTGGPGDEAAPDATTVIDRSQAEAARAEAGVAAPPSARPPHRARERSRRRRRGALAALAAVLAVLAIGGGLYALSRQSWFVGASDHGLVTLYRGVPYELPFGIDLYSQEYESAVPAASLPAEQRRAVLDHRSRSRADAVDLVRQLETGRTSPAAR